MPAPQALLRGQFYHIFGRGIGGQTIFRHKRDYHRFLNLYAKHIEPIAKTYGYNLLPNHYHFLIRTLDPDEQKLPDPSITLPREPSQHFSNLLNGYAKYFNLKYKRTGSLFQGPFGRIEVTSARYFSTLLVYIHRNAQHHGIVDDFREWPYSSYHAFLSRKVSRLQRTEAMSWFPDPTIFVDQHLVDVNPNDIAFLLPEDFE